MTKKVYFKNEVISYDLQYKQVKNINLRIKSDGTIHVSANKRIPQSVIEEFILSKGDFILKAKERFKAKSEVPKHQYFPETEIREVILKLCEKAYPYFEKRGVKYPEIKFRRMISRWGSCHLAKGILTFNINLMYAPIECIEYVVWHEFTHFLHANHSNKFYDELSKVCPGWKDMRKILKEINLR